MSVFDAALTGADFMIPRSAVCAQAVDGPARTPSVASTAATAVASLSPKGNATRAIPQPYATDSTPTTSGTVSQRQSGYNGGMTPAGGKYLNGLHFVVGVWPGSNLFGYRTLLYYHGPFFKRATRRSGFGPVAIHRGATEQAAPTAQRPDAPGDGLWFAEEASLAGSGGGGGASQFLRAISSS